MSTATSVTNTPSRLRTHTAKRILLAVELLLLLLVLAALATTFYLRHTLHANLAQLDGEVHIAGLSAPVTITRDPHGVPSLHASSLDDLLFAQGYLTAHLPTNLIADMYPVGSWRDHPPMQPPVDLTAPVHVPQIPLDNSQSSLRSGAPSSPTASSSAKMGSQDLHATPQDLLTINTALFRETCEGCRARSYNWAIAGNRSATGAPLLSDDMHLSLSATGIWYEAALHINDHFLDVEGFTLPGVPFVIVDRNQHVAWVLLSALLLLALDVSQNKM